MKRPSNDLVVRLGDDNLYNSIKNQDIGRYDAVVTDGPVIVIYTKSDVPGRFLFIESFQQEVEAVFAIGGIQVITVERH